MSIFYVLLTGYLLFALTRTLYQIATGFLYVAPAIKKSFRRYRPLVSVIIPAWNEETGIIKTIRSIVENGYDNVEVIVVDDGSTDTTRNRALRLAQRLGQTTVNLRLISQDNSGKATALNTGIAAAGGELIVTVDADSYLLPGSIQELVTALSNKDYAVAIGEIVVGNTKRLIGKMQHYEYLVCFHFKRTQHIFNSAYIFPGALTAFRASILKETGEFTDYSSTEDLDISMRIKAQGYRVAYVDTAVCVTEGATSLRSLLDQRIRWRHGFLECIVRRREFVWSSRKGRYLSYVDFPLSIIGVLEILFYPAIIAFLAQQLIFHLVIPTLILSYVFVLFILFLLTRLRSDVKVSPTAVLLMPVALSAITTIEYAALVIALSRLIRRKKTSWTIWQRTGEH